MSHFRDCECAGRDEISTGISYLRTRKAGRQLHPAAILTPDAEITQPEDFDLRKAMKTALL
jgi:hypothetical protein